MKIKICKHFPKVKKFHKKLTKTFPGDTIIIKSCISMCKTCKKLPVAKVNGVKIKGRSMGKIIHITAPTKHLKKTYAAYAIFSCLK